MAVDGQLAAHYYLDTIPMEGPLRQDVINFIDWLPADLGTVMELGSGFGKMARALLKRCRRYVCVDLDKRMFASMPEELSQHATVADIHALPFEDRVYDTVLANNVLEHSYDPVRCLQEIRRVLKPGGRLFALIPLDALNRDYALPSHLWKADIANIDRAVAHGRPEAAAVRHYQSDRSRRRGKLSDVQGPGAQDRGQSRLTLVICSCRGGNWPWFAAY